MRITEDIETVVPLGRVCSIVFLSLLLPACASFHTVLINSDRQVVRCASTGPGNNWIGVVMASNVQDNCVKAYETAGYLELKDFGSVGISEVSDDLNVITIRRIVDQSPASRAGVIPGDIIQKLNGQPVRTAKEAMRLLVGRRENNVEISLMRGQEQWTATLTLESYAALHGQIE